jgi:hypothetical protein
MTISWFLLGLNTRERLPLWNGRRDWWQGHDTDALKFASAAECSFDTQANSLVHWINKNERHRVGGRLPDRWLLSLVKRFRQANPAGLQLVTVNDIWPGPGDYSPFSRPGDNADAVDFLPTLGFIEHDANFDRLCRYLPELRDPAVVSTIIDEMKARGTDVDSVG